MFSKKGPPGDGSLVPSDAQSREKLVLYVYEYLLHMGAKQAAATFLQEIHYDKNITTLQDPPGFLQSWWCVFWDLYCAAPERRDTHRYSTEAKTFHDFGFVNSGYSVNGLHGPNPAPSPLGLPSQGPDGMQAGSAGMGPPHSGFFPPPVPGPHMRPSPPQQSVSQPSPHGLLNQTAFMTSARYQGPNPRPGAGVRLGQEPQPPFVPGPNQSMFPDQVRGNAPHLMPPQRLPPGSSHHRPVGLNSFPGMRPNMGPVMGPGMPAGPPHLQRSWPGSSVHFPEPGPGGQFGPPMSGSNGPAPAGGPGTPVMRSPQNLPDGSGPERFGMMQPSGGPAMGAFSMGPEPSNVGVMNEMLMNGDGLDIKHSPASTHGGLNGGTPGPGGPNSVPPSTSGESCSLDFGMHPFQATDHEAEIRKIKDSICEESRRFEGGKGDSESGGDYYTQ